MNFWKPKFPISQLKRVGRNVYFDRAAVLAAAKDRETSVDPVEYRSQESAAKSADIHEESSQLLRQYRQANAI